VAAGGTFQKVLWIVCFVSAASFCQNSHPKIENQYAQRFPGIPGSRYLAFNYIRSGLSPEAINEILGIPSGMSEQALEERIESRKGEGGERQKGSGKLDGVDRMFFRAMHYALGVNFETRDRAIWKSLAEKRYSYLRDLLTALSDLPGMMWQAWDYKASDGARVFRGKEGEILLIDRKTGDFFFGRDSTAFKGSSLRPDYSALTKVIRSKLYCSYSLLP
jgi:hypothetical protein